jgi:hypothetical protein
LDYLTMALSGRGTGRSHSGVDGEVPPVRLQEVDAMGKTQESVFALPPDDGQTATASQILALLYY